MTNKTQNLITAFNSEYARTSGKKADHYCTYISGWFRIPTERKPLRATALEAVISTLKAEPTAVAHMEMVNGVSTLIPADKHVVRSIVGGNDVIEDKDTPYGCSVGDEAYWSN